MLNRPCLGCGKPVKASRCDECQAKMPKRQEHRNRPSRQQRGYDSEYDRNAALVIENARQYGRPCWKCGKHFKPGEKITVDHIIPLRRGGTNGLENLAPACTRCNYGWRKARGYV